MKTFVECIPCFFRQALDAARLVSGDEIRHKEILDRLARLIPDFSLSTTPPEMARHVYQMLNDVLGEKAYYNDIKERSNRIALELYPKLKEKVEGAGDRMLVAVEIAIAGNVIDYAAKNSMDIDEELDKLFRDDGDMFQKAVFEYAEFISDLDTAKMILYVADNAGEIVFDKVLIGEFDGKKEVIFAVREKPVINDALVEDAMVYGLDKVARVISSGVYAPGTLREP